MRSLLTSAGIANASSYDALVDLLGTPIGESSALVIPAAVPLSRGCGHGVEGDQRYRPEPFVVWVGSPWECWSWPLC